MAKWIFVVSANSKDKEKEAEFNEWYDNIHIPDVLETDGFISARRFEIQQLREGKGKFLAFYEIESNDPSVNLKLLSESMVGKKAAGRMSDLLEVIDTTMYRQISELGQT